MSDKTLEERVTELEQQAEINRNNINLIIDMLNEVVNKISSAAGAMAKMPHMPVAKNRKGETNN